uniref:Uncharacterized protein n=1 Tax=Megaselia scalaris TaxID=36166 RepID=T1GNQ5_MEGSC
MAEASGYLLDVLENLRDGKIGEGVHEDFFKFTSRDLIVYALGVALTHTTVDLTNILHGEQYIEIMDGGLPQSGELVTRGKVVDVMDKGSGALVVTEAQSYDSNGEYIVKNQSATFVLGAGKFGGKKTPSPAYIPVVPTPNRPADATITYTTSKDQAALYRMSGDLNPLHIDPNFSIVAGHPVPILHGLCTFGFSVRAVLEKYANNDPSLFKAVKYLPGSIQIIPGCRWHLYKRSPVLDIIGGLLSFNINSSLKAIRLVNLSPGSFKELGPEDVDIDDKDVRVSGGLLFVLFVILSKCRCCAKGSSMSSSTNSILKLGEDCSSNSSITDVGLGLFMESLNF